MSMARQFIAEPNDCFISNSWHISPSQHVLMTNLTASRNIARIGGAGQYTRSWERFHCEW